MPCRFLTFLLLLAVFGPSFDRSAAFVAVSDDPVYSVPMAEFDLHSYSSATTRSARAATSAWMTRERGGAWEVYSWNPQTRTPHWIYGSGFQVSTGIDLLNVESIAWTQVESHREVLRADPEALRFDEARSGMGQIGAHFQQTYEGIDVLGGGVRLVFHESGRLFVLGSDFYPGIALDPEPTLSRRAAEEIARRDFPNWGPEDEVEAGTSLFILPVPVSETQVDYRLVWRARVHTESPLGIWVTHVDAHSGEIVYRYNDVHFADYVGSCEGQVQPSTWCNGEQPEVLRHMDVEIVGVGTVQSGPDGSWTLPNGDDTPRTANAELYGRYTNVDVFAGTDATFSGTATPGVPFAVTWNDANSRQDERDVYDAVSDVVEFFEQVDTDFVDATNRILARVNMPGSCNAYWNGSINFYPEVGGCANTGEIQGVVYHEYGHGVQARVVGWQGNEGLGEGNADVLANLITQESVIGRGFSTTNCEGGIRDSKNTLIYPDNVVGQEIHAAGRVIAGFHWDSMELFQQFYGTEEGTLTAADRWHYGRWVYKPTNQPDQVFATFLIDDDDGNLDNGTPNYDVFCAAASNHGFDCPPVTAGVFITHDTLWNTETSGPRTIPAYVVSTEASLDSVLVIYRIDGGSFHTVSMAPSGGPDEYAGDIPGLESPNFVEYYLRGVDALGNAKNYPTFAPYDLESFHVALLYDPIEDEGGWSVNLEGTDDATAGIWERVDPNFTLIQPEDDATPDPGTMCWITGQASVGGLPTDNDVDGGETSLYSPVFSLSGLGQAYVRYTKWFHNSRGNNANEDPWRVYARNDGGPWIEIENTLETSAGWEPVGANLLALFGGPVGDVQFRFVAVDWIGDTLVDAGLDDFMILGSSDPSSVDEPVSESARDRFALYGNEPNPVSDHARIRFQVPATSRVEVTLYDVAGRAVRELVRGTFGPGSHEVAWDGRDTQGHVVASGVYFYRMKAPGFDVTRSLVVRR